MPAPLPNPHINDSSLGHGGVVSNDLLCSTDCCYEVQDFLGEGVFGQVARCREVDTNKEVAIKIVKNHPDHVLMAEVAMLKRISREDPEKNHFVRWYEWFQYRGLTCLVFELLELSLFDYVVQTQFRSMPLKDIKAIVQQLAIALNKLKSLGLIHTDIKPENVMLVGPVGQPFRVKMIDFGLACNISDVQPGDNVQTRFYRSPEVLLGLPFSEAIDMWSLGCVAVGLFLGYLLFPGRSAYEMLRYITQIQGQPADHLLNAGLFTKSFFVKGSEWNYPRWRLKTPEEYKGDANLGSEENGRYIYSSLEELKGFKLPSNLEPTEMMAEVGDREMFVDLVRQMLQLDACRRITPLQVLDHPFITSNRLIKSEMSGFRTLSTYELLLISNHDMARRPVIPLQGGMAREDNRTSSHVNFDTSRGVIPKKSLNVEVGSAENSHCDLHQAQKSVLVQAVNISLSHSVRDEDKQQEHRDFGLDSIHHKVDLSKKDKNLFLPVSSPPDPTSNSSCLITKGSQNKTPRSSSDSINVVFTDTVNPSLYQQHILGIPSPVRQSVSLQATQWKRKMMETEFSESRNRKKIKLEQPFLVPKTCYSPGRGEFEDGQHGHIVTKYLPEMPAPLPNPHIKDSSVDHGGIVSNDLLCSTDCCYEVQDFLGEGVFGQVARCREVDTNKEVAIKIVKNHPDHVLMAEVAMLKRISREDPEKNHFVRWYEWFQYRGLTCLVFELLELSLFDYVVQTQFRPMPLKDIKAIVQSPEVFLGLPFSEAIPGRSAYEMLRYITQIQGLPADHLLNAGLFTKSFFVKGSEWNYPRWRLKTPEEYKGDANLGSEENGWYIYRSLEVLKELPSNLEPTELIAEVCDREMFVDLVRQMHQLDAGRGVPPVQVLDHPFITSNRFIKGVKPDFQTLSTSGLLPINHEMARRPGIPLQGDMAREDNRTSSHVNFDASRGVIPPKSLSVEVGSFENSHCDLHQTQQSLLVQAVNISLSHFVRDDDKQQEHRNFHQTSYSSCLITKGSQNKTPRSSSDSINVVFTDTVNPSLYQQDILGIPNPVQQSVSLQATQWKRKRMETEFSESRNAKKIKFKKSFLVPKTCYSPVRGGVEDGQHGHIITSLSAPQQILQQSIPPVKMEQTQSLVFLPLPTPPDRTNDAPSSANKSDFQRHQADRLSSSLDSGDSSLLPTNHTSSSQQNNLPNLTRQSVPLQAAQWGGKKTQTENTKSKGKGAIVELLIFFLTTDTNPTVLGNKDRQKDQNEIGWSFQIQTCYSFNKGEIVLASCFHSSSVPVPIPNNSPSAFTMDSLMEETDRQSSFFVSGEAVSLTTCLCQQDVSMVHGLTQKRVPAPPPLMVLWSLEESHQESLAFYLFFPIQIEKGSQRFPLLSNITETPPTASAQLSIKPRPPVVTVQIQIQIQFQYVSI